ncbi:MAG: hypothetical protein ABIH03_03550 [Pseudomonadota bacterium]
MRRRTENLEGWVEVLNQMSIRTSIAGGTAPKENLVALAIRVTEEARKRDQATTDRQRSYSKRPLFESIGQDGLFDRSVDAHRNRLWDLDTECRADIQIDRWLKSGRLLHRWANSRP